ncbi:YetF domain-containing protein [Segetibacter koreensis]|uniref:YetF domain-containing protein n=1 Tax=Segetibacter koreensis TaxID=398037 RepID=UPI000A01E110
MSYNGTNDTFDLMVSIHHPSFGVMVKGQHTCLYRNGTINEANLKTCLLSKSDLMEGVRKEGNTTSLDDIDEVYIEANGEFSVIKKSK